MRVDVAASEPHYLRHLLPVWKALPEEARGRLVTWGKAAEVLPTGEDPGERGDAVVCAGWADIRGVWNRYQKRALMEHGAGQTYSVDGFQDPSYAGAPGRELVDLFLCPNERVARLNRAATPGARSVVVGTPALDVEFTRPRPALLSDGPVVVTSHWVCKVCPEAMGPTGWVAPAVLALLEVGVPAVGHAHPRAAEWVELDCRRKGAPFVRDWEEASRDAAVLLVDNSSVAYEFLASGRPLAWLEPPWFRRDVRHGMRFWDHADAGPPCRSPENAPAAAAWALEQWPHNAKRAAQVVDEVHPVRDGSAARRAVEALLGL